MTQGNLTEEEQSIIDAIKTVTGVAPVVLEESVAYSYMDKYGRGAERIVSFVPAKIESERLLLTLRKCLMYARLDHIPEKVCAACGTSLA